MYKRQSIHDRKGITEKVELVSGNQAKELKNWTVYNFPVDYSFIKDKKYNDTKILPAMPAYYKSTFKLDKVGAVSYTHLYLWQLQMQVDRLHEGLFRRQWAVVHIDPVRIA